jgi:enoyl-CoA hydratase/carnithine racemase
MSQPLLVEKEGAVISITINRSETRNVLDGEDLYSAFEEVCSEINVDASICAAILTGAGKAFSAGGDIHAMRDRSGMFAGSPGEIRNQYRHGIQRIPLALSQLEVPIIAAVNGPAIGAGCDLACMCDIRIASDAAVFAESFVKLGIIPGDGGAWFLPRAIGMSRAVEMALTGDVIDSKTALSYGLVSRVVAPEELLPEARRLAGRIASNSPEAVRWTKKLLHEAQHLSLASTLELAANFQALAHHTASHRDALDRFFQERSNRGKRNNG